MYLQSFNMILTLSQTTNFTLFQTERVCRQRFKVDGNCRKFSKQIENTVGKGEIARYSVFKRPVLHTRKNQGLFGKGLTKLSEAFAT